jgi:hypothetical protein
MSLIDLLSGSMETFYFIFRAPRSIKRLRTTEPEVFKMYDIVRTSTVDNPLTQSRLRKINLVLKSLYVTLT